MIKNLLIKLLCRCMGDMVVMDVSRSEGKTTAPKSQTVAVGVKEAMYTFSHRSVFRTFMIWGELISEATQDRLAKVIKDMELMVRTSNLQYRWALRYLRWKSNNRLPISKRVEITRLALKWQIWRKRARNSEWRLVAEVATAICKTNNLRFYRKEKKAKRNNMSSGWSWSLMSDLLDTLTQENQLCSLL